MPRRCSCLIDFNSLDLSPQASSGIVQTAQTIDSLLATFVFDETFALQVRLNVFEAYLPMILSHDLFQLTQLSPKFEVVWWSASACSATSDLDDCTPFRYGTAQRHTCSTYHTHALLHS